MLVGAALAVAGDIAGNEPRMLLPQRFGPEAQPRRRAGREILDEHVGLRDHPVQQRGVSRILEVEGDGLLAPVEPDEIGRLAVHHRIVVAREIAARPLDLDDPRPGVGQLRRAQRRRHGLVDGDDENIGEGVHGDAARISHENWRRCLFENGGEAGNHIFRDMLRDGFEALAVPGGEIEGAGLVAANHAGRPGACARERHRETAPARETPARSDGQDDRCPGQPVERSGGNDQDRPGSLLFVARGRVEADEPDIAPLHYNNSLPTGLASIHS